MAISRSDRGAALPLALVVTLTLVALVTDVDLRSRLSFDRARRAAQMAEARSLLSKLEMALGAASSDQLDALAGGAQEFDLDEFKVTIRMSPPEAKLNVNRLNDLIVGEPIQRLVAALLKHERFEQRALSCALDWVDADDDPRPSGAERLDYSGEDVSPRNGPFETVDELSFVRGFRDESAFGRIRPLITTFGSGKIYLPAADPELIDMITDAYGPAVRNYIDDLRRNPDRSIQIPSTVMPEKDLQSLQSILTPKPTAWMVTIDIETRNFHTRADYVLNLDESVAANHRIVRIG